MRERAVEGWGLHTGRPARVVLSAKPGPSALALAGHRVPMTSLRIAAAERSTAVHVGPRRVSTVEHLMAACAALGAYEGLEVEVHDGDELPLLDGSARRWFEILHELGLVRTPPPLTVRAPGEVLVGQSRYEFACRADPTAVEVSVDVDYGDPRIARSASWGGDAVDFGERIAVARTFGFAHEVEELARRGLATHIAPESVVVFTPDAVLSAGRPFVPDEPARHKLLDLMGDLFVHGGPPLGAVRATRPGHAATHEAMRLALERGLVARA